MTDRRTEGRRDKPSYRDARTHLKSGLIILERSVLEEEVKEEREKVDRLRLTTQLSRRYSRLKIERYISKDRMRETETDRKISYLSNIDIH